MEVSTEIIQNLTHKGTLAYLAVLIRGGGEWSTAHLAGAVNARTEILRDGLEELSQRYPAVVQKGKARKWVSGSAVLLQNLDSRRADLLDDLKRYWDHMNGVDVPFEFSAADGASVAMFLRTHPNWNQEMWRAALNNRCKSEAVNHLRPFHKWIGSLVTYVNGPLDEFGKPRGKGGNHGRQISTEQLNSAARQQAIAKLSGRSA